MRAAPTAPTGSTPLAAAASASPGWRSVAGAAADAPRPSPWAARGRPRRRALWAGRHVFALEDTWKERLSTYSPTPQQAICRSGVVIAGDCDETCRVNVHTDGP